LSGAALKAHSYKQGCYNATYRFRQTDIFESDKLQTDRFHEQVSELQARGVTDRGFLPAECAKHSGAL
jgi:hypothetical protein